MADAREARRQRILKRGSERLAFITGDRKSLEVGLGDRSISSRIEPEAEIAEVTTHPEPEISVDRRGEQEIVGKPEVIYQAQQEIKQPQGRSDFSVQAFEASIDASRSVRALLSLVVGIHTVVFGAGFVDVGVKFWDPVLLLFVASASVIIFFMHFRSSTKKKTGWEAPQGPSSSIDRAVNLLSAVLAARKAASALSLDFAIYIVTVISLFPIVQST